MKVEVEDAHRKIYDTATFPLTEIHPKILAGINFKGCIFLRTPWRNIPKDGTALR